MRRIPHEPTRVTFCPIPIHPGTDSVSLVKVGKLIGTLVWGFQNGDALVRTEDSIWYVPKPFYATLGQAKLK